MNYEDEKGRSVMNGEKRNATDETDVPQGRYRIVTRIEGRPPSTSWIGDSLVKAQRAKKQREADLVCYPRKCVVVIEEIPSKRWWLSFDWRGVGNWLAPSIHPAESPQPDPPRKPEFTVCRFEDFNPEKLNPPEPERGF